MQSLTTKLLLAAALLVVAVLMHAQSRKPVTITRLYTGPDGETHTEQVEMQFTGGSPTNQTTQTVKATGTELHRSPPGDVQPFHTAPRPSTWLRSAAAVRSKLPTATKCSLVPARCCLWKTPPAKATSRARWRARTGLRSRFPCPTSVLS